jgi:ubiquitin-large subunit ribosomal protein L40e
MAWPTPQTFSLGVKLLSGKSFSVMISLSDTVGALKQRIFEREGIPPQRQNLLVAGKLLHPDSRHLSEYNLKPGDMVYVTAGVRGISEEAKPQATLVKPVAPVKAIVSPVTVTSGPNALASLLVATNPSLAPTTSITGVFVETCSTSSSSPSAPVSAMVTTTSTAIAIAKTSTVLTTAKAAKDSLRAASTFTMPTLNTWHHGARTKGDLYPLSSYQPGNNFGDAVFYCGLQADVMCPCHKGEITINFGYGMHLMNSPTFWTRVKCPYKSGNTECKYQFTANAADSSALQYLFNTYHIDKKTPIVIGWQAIISKTRKQSLPMMSCRGNFRAWIRTNNAERSINVYGEAVNKQKTEENVNFMVMNAYPLDPNDKTPFCVQCGRKLGSDSKDNQLNEPDPNTGLWSPIRKPSGSHRKAWSSSWSNPCDCLCCDDCWFSLSAQLIYCGIKLEESSGSENCDAHTLFNMHVRCPFHVQPIGCPKQASEGYVMGVSVSEFLEQQGARVGPEASVEVAMTEAVKPMVAFDQKIFTIGSHLLMYQLPIEMDENQKKKSVQIGVASMTPNEKVQLITQVPFHKDSNVDVWMPGLMDAIRKHKNFIVGKKKTFELPINNMNASLIPPSLICQSKGKMVIRIQTSLASDMGYRDFTRGGAPFQPLCPEHAEALILKWCIPYSIVFFRICLGDVMDDDDDE